MADETYRPRKIVPEPGFEENWEEEVPPKGTPVPQRSQKSGRDKLAGVQAMREVSAADRGDDAPPPMVEGLDIQGNMPPQLQAEMSEAKGDRSAMKPSKRRSANAPKKPREKKKPFADNQLVTNDGVKELLKRVQPFVDLNYDEIMMGKTVLQTEFSMCVQ